MPSGGKCAECERRGRPCVVSSWEALDRASDNLSSKISEDEKKVEQLLDELDEVRRRLVTMLHRLRSFSTRACPSSARYSVIAFVVDHHAI